MPCSRASAVVRAVEQARTPASRDASAPGSRPGRRLRGRRASGRRVWRASCTAVSLRASLLWLPMSSRSIRVVRVCLLVAIVAWFFSPPDWRYAIPLWLPFVVALVLEVEFAVGGLRQRRPPGRARARPRPAERRPRAVRLGRRTAGRRGSGVLEPRGRCRDAAAPSSAGSRSRRPCSASSRSSPGASTGAAAGVALDHRTQAQVEQRALARGVAGSPVTRRTCAATPQAGTWARSRKPTGWPRSAAGTRG